jgi:hypothetical protein
VPIDELGRSVQRAEQELQMLRQRQLDDTEQLWARYKSGYERYLHTATEPELPDSSEDPAGAAQTVSAVEVNESPLSAVEAADDAPSTEDELKTPDEVTP